MGQLIQTRTSRYTDHEIERGLTALALAGDNSPRASKLTGVPQKTLRNWRTAHPERYNEIRVERAREIDQLCISEFRDIALNANRATLNAVELERKRINTGEVRDASASARNLATTAAIATDKIALMEGRPTQIVEHRGSEDIMRGLTALGIVTTAEPITDAEIAEP